MSTLSTCTADATQHNGPQTCQPVDAVMSRRSLLTSLRVHPRSNVATAAIALAGLAAATAASRAEPRAVSGDADPSALIAKLVRRVTFGFTQAELQVAQTMGYTNYLEYQLNPAAIDDSAMDTRLAAYTTLTMNCGQLLALTATQVVNELWEATILRSIFSKRQLLERMVEFWSDHFSIDVTIESERFLKPIDDRDVIRANALGSFPAMLRASAQSAAMSLYLNNNTNVASSPNENYARELMELHTLSINGPYTQNDVREVARCFTGWNYNRLVANNASSGTFVFNSSSHDNGQKTVLGQVIPAGGGVQDGFTVLNILANHPATANFIASKLCKRFLGEDVRQSVIASVAATYTSTGGDIKAMLRTLLKPDNLFTDFGPRYKRPYHMMISAVRALNAAVTSTSTLRQTHLFAAGQVPFSWGPPDGYPDTLLYWQGLILPRWNFGANLVINGVSGITFDVATFFSGLTTTAQMIDRINQNIFGGELTAAEITQLTRNLAVAPNDTTNRRDIVGLALGAPSFQWY